MEIGIEQVYEAQCASSSPKANVISRLAKTEDTAKTRVCYASM